MRCARFQRLPPSALGIIGSVVIAGLTSAQSATTPHAAAARQ